MASSHGRHTKSESRARHPTASSTVGDVICPRRLAALTAAVELEVDPDEVHFESREERLLWEDLREEFQSFVTKIGPVWIAD